MFQDRANQPRIMDGLEKVPGIFGGIVYLDEGAGVVHIRTGCMGRLGHGKHVGKNGRVGGENSTEYFEDDVLCLDHDVSVIVPDVLTSDKGRWGDERRHVVRWYLEAGHGGLEVGVLGRKVRHALKAEERTRFAVAATDWALCPV